MPPRLSILRVSMASNTGVPRPASRPERRGERRWRAFWLKQLHQWHWMSSAVCLIAMLLFAATGITLNHAGEIESRPTVTSVEAALPARLHAALAAAPPRRGRGDLPSELRAWLEERLRIDLAGRPADWSPDGVYVALPRPGGDAWLDVALRAGTLLYEDTDRGWIAYLNDLHKGRDTGTVWRWFIDIFSAAALVFCLTGLLLLQLHAGRRPATWPIVGLGLVVPLALILIFVH